MPSVEEIQKDIDWIEKTIQNNTPINECLFADTPKKNLIVVWAEKLEQLAKHGIYQKPISTISTHIFNRLKELGMEKNAHYVRKVLMSKYKDESKIHNSEELESRENNSHEISSIEHTKKELQYLALLQLEKETCEKLIIKFSDKNFLKDLSHKENLLFDELITKLESTTVSCHEIIDERTGVPFMKQFLFFYARTQTTLGNTYTLFVRYLKEYSVFTTKQIGKISDGRISKVILLYEPKTRLEAMNVGFYGIPCESCGSYRTKPKIEYQKDKLFCFKCEHFQDLKTERLPLSD